MKLVYSIKIEKPENHLVHVKISGSFPANKTSLNFFLPRWSPGSYLIREYSRHLSKLRALNKRGEVLHFVQSDISTFTLDLAKSDVKDKGAEFELSYDVYCHELTVRTSHVDTSHAFLHLPTMLMGVLDEVVEAPTLNLHFPPLWTKISTGLKDISQKREDFIYSAISYDELIDCPIEIGCHDTDGFEINGVKHELAHYGEVVKLPSSLKADIKTIVDTIQKSMGGFPYDYYLFLTHFVPGLYGGLEHSNSTALHYCPFNITTRKGYLNYLCLVSHEYFHTWNVKRIRPDVLGPFNYLKEATTPLLWLAEGLTSLMDELYVYRAKLMSIDEYLDLQKDNLNRYLSIPGRKFHSLDESSFNAWIKLYRPDENTNNSSISYYLKGGIVFFFLNIILVEKGKSIDDLLKKLWERTLKKPEIGVSRDEVLKMVEEIGGEEVLRKFETWVETCEEIDIEALLLKMGVKTEWENTQSPWLGIDTELSGDRVMVKVVTLDGPGYKGGLNAGDEIIAINGFRILKDKFAEITKYLEINQTYTFTVSRLGRLLNTEVNLDNVPRKIKSLTVDNKDLVIKTLNPPV